MTLGIMNQPKNTIDEDLIQLVPLVHQVGGHSSMFVLDDVTVCKPLIGREYQFYRTLPPEIKKYAPEFRGSLQVILQEDRNGISMAALPNEQTLSLRNSKRPFKNGRSKLQRVSSSSLEFESSSSDDEENLLPSKPSTSSLYTTPLTPGGEPKNPWLQECHQNHLSKLKQKSDSSNAVECIMLENLTFKYRYPCVLDLKMGTRQYGDDATESKRRSQTYKASKTTTVSLGVRLAGMQVYNKEMKCFTCKNKYYGRQLSEDGFKQALKQFLHNGKRLQLDIMEAIIKKLKELRAIVSKLESFRFFTSSLLILYDSADSLYKSHSSEKVEQVVFFPDNDHLADDRENCCPQETSDDQSRQKSWLKPPRVVSPVPSAASNNNGTRETAPSSKSKPGPKHRVPRVDIRLIDFAHATHKGMGDSISYSGPDDGILLGLNSLIKIFQDLRDKYDHHHS